MPFLGARKGCGLGKKIWGEDFQKGLKSVLDILDILKDVMTRCNRFCLKAIAKIY